MRTYPSLEATPIWKLFNYFWWVQAPQVHLLTDHHIQLYGTPTSGDLKHDEAALKQMVLCQLPAVRDPEQTPQIKSILELILDGVPVQFEKPQEIAKLYDLLVEHVQVLAEYFSESMFFSQRAIQASPEKQRVLQDASDLQEFINALHPVVERWRPEPVAPPSDFLQMLEYWRHGVGTNPLFEREQKTYTNEAPDVFNAALSGLGRERVRAWR
jgi:hypothetical protein